MAEKAKRGCGGHYGPTKCSRFYGKMDRVLHNADGKIQVADLHSCDKKGFAGLATKRAVITTFPMWLPTVKLHNGRPARDIQVWELASISDGTSHCLFDEYKHALQAAMYFVTHEFTKHDAYCIDYGLALNKEGELISDASDERSVK